MSLQLSLPLYWPDQATFDNFYANGNEEALTCIQEMLMGIGEKSIYLQGESGSGLSHLLYAACHTLHSLGKTALYVPLKKQNLSPNMLEGAEYLSLVCLDNVDAIAGNPLWEEALFYCYERLRTTDTYLLTTAYAPPTTVPWKLPDLGSRFAASTIFTIHSLSDAHKILALQHRAKKRGLELSNEVGHYLLNHFPRDMHALFSLLQHLDQKSLMTQHKLTIPFVKKILQV